MPPVGDISNFNKRLRRRRRYKPRTVLTGVSKRAGLFRTFLARKVNLRADALFPEVLSVLVSSKLGKAVRTRRPRIKLKPYRFLGVRYFRKTLGQTVPRLLLNAFKRSYGRLTSKSLRPCTGAVRPTLTPRARRARSRRRWRFRRTLPRKLRVRSARKLYSRARKLLRIRRRASQAASYGPHWALGRQNPNKPLNNVNRLGVSQLHYRTSLTAGLRSRPSLGALLPLPDLLFSNRSSVLAMCVGGIAVAPLYSRTFKRSPFFFVNLVTLPTPSSLDLLTSIREFTPRFKHHLFPSANYLKTEIFRKLNRQKALASARMLSFNSPFSVRGEQSHSFRSRLDSRSHLTAQNAPSTPATPLLGLQRSRLAPTLSGLL